MDALKKPETLITAVLALILIGYIAYDYRKHNAQAEKIKTIEEHLSATVRTVDAVTQQTGRIQPLITELVKLKERQEELEELEDKCKELVESLEEMIESLKGQGMSVDIDFPEFGEEKKSKKKGKKGKKDKKSKKEKEKEKKSKKSKKKKQVPDSDESSDDSSSEEEDKSKAIERISRLRDRKKSK